MKMQVLYIEVKCHILQKGFHHIVYLKSVVFSDFVVCCFSKESDDKVLWLTWNNGSSHAFRIEAHLLTPGLVMWSEL